MDIQELIDSFNEGDNDFLKYFGNDVVTFFKFLDKRGLLGELDPEGTLIEDYQNELLLFYYENDDKKFWEHVLNFLSDVEMIDNDPYLVIDTQGELAKLFCDDRDISRRTIEELLDGDYDMNYWSSYDLTDNIYRDVIEELTKENLRYLKEYIIKGLERDQIETSTELLASIAERQGHPEYVVVDQSNIDEIVDDEDTMKELLNNELSDLNSDLYSVYHNAYSSAYESELYNDIWNELSTYFNTEKRQWVSRPHIYKKDTEVQKFMVPIVNFETNILDYLHNNKGYRNATLEYWGSYISMIDDGNRCLSFRVPDWPDSREVDKNINEYFGEYI
jgi:hypothetical protein